MALAEERTFSMLQIGLCRSRQRYKLLVILKNPDTVMPVMWLLCYSGSKHYMNCVGHYNNMLCILIPKVTTSFISGSHGSHKVCWMLMRWMRLSARASCLASTQSNVSRSWVSLRIEAKCEPYALKETLKHSSRWYFTKFTGTVRPIEVPFRMPNGHVSNDISNNNNSNGLRNSSQAYNYIFSCLRGRRGFFIEFFIDSLDLLLEWCPPCILDW